MLQKHAGCWVGKGLTVSNNWWTRWLNLTWPLPPALQTNRLLQPAVVRAPDLLSPSGKRRSEREAFRLMKISVAMCTYNGARYLREQLDSIAAQTRHPEELVVCDDGS